jgi:hypothetical protein
MNKIVASEFARHEPLVKAPATLAVAKMVKAWETKNAKRAAKGAGMSLMAVSLAACQNEGTSDINLTSAGDLSFSMNSNNGSGNGSSAPSVDPSYFIMQTQLLISQIEALYESNRLQAEQNELQAEQNKLIQDQIEAQTEASEALIARMIADNEALIASIGDTNALLVQRLTDTNEALTAAMGEGYASMILAIQSLENTLQGSLSSLATAIADSLAAIDATLSEQLLDLIASLDDLTDVQSLNLSQIATTLNSIHTIMNDGSLVRRGVIENGEGSDDNGDLFILSSGDDVYVGSDNDDVFIAPLVTAPFLLPVSVSSLNAQDILDGGAGDDVLYVTTNAFTGAFAGINPVITNIETIKITTEWPAFVGFGGSLISGLSLGEGDYPVNYSFENVTGLQELWSLNADSNQPYAPPLTIVEIQNLVDLKVQGAGAGHVFSVYYADGAIEAAVGEEVVKQNITFVGSNGAEYVDQEQTAATVYVDDADDNIDEFNVIADADAVNYVILSDNGNVTKITLTQSDTTETAVETGVFVLTVNGMSSLEAVDSTAFNADVVLDLSQLDLGEAGVTVSTGSGDDVITLSSGKDTVVFDITTGGNDTIIGFESDDTISIKLVSDETEADALADALADSISLVSFIQGDESDNSWNVKIDFEGGSSLTLEDLFTFSYQNLGNFLADIFGTQNTVNPVNNESYTVAGNLIDGLELQTLFTLELSINGGGNGLGGDFLVNDVSILNSNPPL